MQRERLSGLDQARSIAIIAVVAVHLSFQFPHLPQWATVLARMGQYGVQLFFVISAITIFMTLGVDSARYRAASHVAARFYIKRFFRIAPLYYVAILAYGAMSWYTYRFMPDHASILGQHDAGDILGALDVAGQPIKASGGAAEHGRDFQAPRYLSCRRPDSN